MSAIQYPQSTQYEFYCYQNGMSLDEYREKISCKDEATLDLLAELYDEVTYDVYNQLFVVEKDGKFNFWSETALEWGLTPEIPLIFDFCHLYPGFAVVRKGNQVGNLFFNEGLSEPASYRTVDVFEVKRNGFYGVKSSTGVALLSCTFRFVKIYPEFILAKSRNGYIFFHLDGTKMFGEDCFSEVDLSKMINDLIYVQKNELWGVVHVTGYWNVPALYREKEDITWWGYGYFCCMLNGKKGLYNKQGKLIIPHEYDQIEYGRDWRPHPFIVTLNGKQGLTDCKGNPVFPCIYDEITCIGSHYRMWKDGKDSLWEISHLNDVVDLTPFQETVTNCQLIESSCVDFYRIPWSLSFLRDEYSHVWWDDDNNNKRMDHVNKMEANRWLLMYRVVDDMALEKDFLEWK